MRPRRPGRVRSHGHGCLWRRADREPAPRRWRSTPTRRESARADAATITGENVDVDAGIGATVGSNNEDGTALTQTIDISASGNTAISGVWNADQSITVSGGQGEGGFGGVSTYAGGDGDIKLVTTDITVRAGEFGGDINLAQATNATQAILDASDSVTLEAFDGRIVHEAGEISATRLDIDAGLAVAVQTNLDSAAPTDPGRANLEIDTRSVSNVVVNNRGCSIAGRPSSTVASPSRTSAISMRTTSRRRVRASATRSSSAQGFGQQRGASRREPDHGWPR